MKQRIISAVLGLLLLAVVLIYNKYILIPSVILLSFFALWEFENAFKNRYNSMVLLSYIFATSNYILVVSNNLQYLTANLIIYIISLLLCIVLKNVKYNIDDISVTLFGYVYSVMFFSYIILLIKLDPRTLFYLVLLLAISWGADTGGYFIGIFFGKHKLCEKLSPKKTIEGLFGGVLFSVLFTWIVILIYSRYSIVNFKMLDLTGDLKAICIFTLIVMILSVYAQMGDLIASSIKRYAGIKDFSNIMPGHGGVLDRFDSTIFIAPILFYVLEVLNYINNIGILR